MRRQVRPGRAQASAARGFSLIEVLIAILILGFGLLGMALLQVMSVRFTQSAAHRTQATHLAYGMLDQIRSNRVLASAYAGEYAASVVANDCVPATGSSAPSDYQKAWQCRMGKALGETASAKVTHHGDGHWQVEVSWGDERWKQDAADTTFSVSTVL